MWDAREAAAARSIAGRFWVNGRSIRGGRRGSRLALSPLRRSCGMDIRLLGPIETSLDSGPAALGPRQQRAVLAMLALELNRTVSIDRLI